MKQHVHWLGVLAVLLGAIVWNWAGARPPAPAPARPFQMIVADLTKTLVPPSGMALSSASSTIEPSRAAAVWVIESDLIFEDFGTLARKSLTEYQLLCADS